MKYEDIRYQDDVLPMIFRKDHRDSSICMTDHWHEPVELILVTKGQLLVQINTETAIAKSGDVVCVHSGHLHSYNSADGQDSEYYCIIFPWEIIGSATLYKSSLPRISTNASVRELYQHIIELMETKPPFYKELAKSHLTQLYVALVQEGGNQTVGNERKMTTTVKAAINYIEEHYAEELDIEQVARCVGISRYHLCHIFKTVTGKTLAVFWQLVRCDQARKLLKKGLSVTEVAEACGFSSAAYFAKVYQKHFSVLPSKDKN